MDKKERAEWIKSQIEEFEKKNGKEVALKWNGRWIKKKELKS